MSQSNFNDILTHYEAEQMIQNLEIQDIKEYGSNNWYKQNEIIQRLNIQAHMNSFMKSPEFIMEISVTYDKIKVLIYELIVSEEWKKNVLPLIKNDIIKLNSYRNYIPIYHEAAVVNMLEILMFHRDTVDSADNYILELIDYCYRKLVKLSNNAIIKNQKEREKKGEIISKEDKIKEVINKSESELYDQQLEDLEFQIQIMCLSIIRYISDYAKFLSISVIHHLISHCDIFCILVPLIEEKPWLRKHVTIQGEELKEQYQDNKWQKIIDENKLNKSEAQIWITIYNLFMDQEVRKKYDLNDFRKNNLLRLRKFMKETLLDQIPALVQMFRSLEELSLMQVSSLALKNPFVVQQMPDISIGIVRNRDWKDIAKYQLTNFFREDEVSKKQDLAKMMEIFGSNVYDDFDSGFICNLCAKPADKRCKGCKQVWYCSKECQTNNWKVHKNTCKEVQKQTQQLLQQQQQQQQQQSQQQNLNNNNNKIQLQEDNQTNSQINEIKDYSEYIDELD